MDIGPPSSPVVTDSYRLHIITIGLLPFSQCPESPTCYGLTDGGQNWSSKRRYYAVH